MVWVIETDLNYINQSFTVFFAHFKALSIIMVFIIAVVDGCSCMKCSDNKNSD